MRFAVLVVALALAACGDTFVSSEDYAKAKELCVGAEVTRIRVLADFRTTYTVEAVCSNHAVVTFRMKGQP